LRRALLTLGGTVAGIAALLAVKFQPAASSTLAAGSQSVPVPSAAAPSAGASAASASAAGNSAGTGKPAATGKPSASSMPRSSSSGASSTGGTGGTTQSTTARTFTGAVDNTQYGPMQVAITVSGKKITKVTVVQETNDGGLSSSIDAMAIPKLTSEALTAQSAKIDAVSGASYTSAGYIQSLQSAVDQAGL
jgi:uncharacterized protein with FMN-binding domain